ncbi:lamin tail domain-containing protein [Streptomyces sp. T1317-0309]|nr:lamin tail domain-containing protein [Streptomyces sp. T1317-0309]
MWGLLTPQRPAPTGTPAPCEGDPRLRCRSSARSWASGPHAGPGPRVRRRGWRARGRAAVTAAPGGYLAKSGIFPGGKASPQHRGSALSANGQETFAACRAECLVRHGSTRVSSRRIKKKRTPPHLSRAIDIRPSQKETPRVLTYTPGPARPRCQGPPRSASLGLTGSLIALPFTAQAAPSSDAAISEVYGGGGNSGASYTNDFIELGNGATAPFDLSGWSVQYLPGSPSATSKWQVTPLAGAIPAGGTYLVQEAKGSAGDTPLPSPDPRGPSPCRRPPAAWHWFTRPPPSPA